MRPADKSSFHSAPGLHVKICGITTLEAAQAAVQTGADLLGFNFYPPSPRAITPKQCAGLVSALSGYRTPHQVLVGVFVNASPADVVTILDDCDLDLAQLSGDEPPEDLSALAGRAYKAVRPRDLAHAYALLQAFTAFPVGGAPVPEALLDASIPGIYGGTGKTMDWDLAAQLVPHYRLLLAGGLNPDNVSAAIAHVHPWGVDVASGVEDRRGYKDPSKIAAFVTAARQAHTACWEHTHHHQRLIDETLTGV